MIPAWSAFQSKTSSKPTHCEVNVGYLPTITESPTKYETIFKILTELEIDFIYLEVDQAIYTNILQLEFQLYRQEGGGDQCENIIVRMGGFHVVICLMRSISSRFRGLDVSSCFQKSVDQVELKQSKVLLYVEMLNLEYAFTNYFVRHCIE